MTFITGSLFLTPLADRYGRKRTIISAIAITGLLAAASGVFANYWLVLISRAGIGLAVALVAPAAQALVAETQAPENRGGAMGILSAGPPAGLIVGLGLWGWITSAFGWQTALVSVGIFSFVLALILTKTIDEPPRPAVAVGKTSFIANIKTLYRVKSYRHMVLAFSITGIGAMGGAQWHPTFLVRVHELNMSTVGIALALISGGVGIISALLSGRIGNALSKRDVRAPMWICMVGVLIAGPLFVAAYLAPSAEMCLLMLTAASLFGYCATPHLFTVTQSATPPALRAFAAGVAMAAFTGCGMALGVPLIGALSDMMTAEYGASGLGYALASIAIFYVWAAVHYALAARHYESDLERVNSA